MDWKKGIQESKKPKHKIKNGLLIGFASIALFTVTLATIELMDFPVLKIGKSYIRQISSKVQALAAEETEDSLPNESNISGIIINGKEYKFTDEKTEYTIDLPYNTEDMITIEYIKKNENQTIIGQNKYIMTEYNKIINIEVFSEDKSNITTYSINLQKEYNAYLKNIEILGYILIPEFNSEILDYKIALPNDVTSINMFATAWDKSSSINIEGQDNVGNGKEITLTVTNEKAGEPITYTITCVDSESIYNYNYTGKYETFTVPHTGSYKFELWGARGRRCTKKWKIIWTIWKRWICFTERLS